MFFRAKQLDIEVNKVLETDSVSKAQKILKSRSGLWMISIISFFESALPLPILTDPFLVAAILANRQNAVRIVALTTLASVLGGVFAYYSAVLFFEVILKFMTAGMVEQFQSLVASNQSNTFVITILGAITPVPYTMVAWVVAVLNGSIWVFAAASALGRGLRYVIVGYSVYRFGPLAISYAKKYIGVISVVVLIIALIYLWLKM